MPAPQLPTSQSDQAVVWCVHSLCFLSPSHLPRSPPDIRWFLQLPIPVLQQVLPRGDWAVPRRMQLPKRLWGLAKKVSHWLKALLKILQDTLTVPIHGFEQLGYLGVFLA